MDTSKTNLGLVIENLDERKLKEIEHSRTRRSILRGFERHSDTHDSEAATELDTLIRDQASFDYHFSNIKYYSITHASEAYQYQWLQERCKPGVNVLDFGCGNGENGIFAAQQGADVIGIDISPEGVDNANLNAEQMGVASNCKFVVMDGENMHFRDNTFDLAVEYGVLHHVDLDRAMSELSRVLKPNGKMICVEALRHNPIIHYYRKKTPHLRTQWEYEHILGVQDLDVVRCYFGEIDVRFFHLAALAAVPLRKTRLFHPARNFFDKIDALLLRNQIIGKFGWIMIFIIGKPKLQSSV
jgi:SAM-dependent methyltransferase